MNKTVRLLVYLCWIFKIIFSKLQFKETYEVLVTLRKTTFSNVAVMALLVWGCLSETIYYWQHKPLVYN